jgi:glutamate-1-semialdehyde 2,1-aminomutase
MNRSQELYEQAQQVLPGGISRNTIYRKPNPDYVDRGEGCYVFDIEGNRRIDFANNMCSLIHGHAHPTIISAVTEQLQRGTAFTLATEAELRFAQHMCNRSESFDKIRFMNSGTEAVMSAIKAARAITGRPKIAKTEGAYHGTYDYAEVSQKAKPENWGDESSPNSVPVAQGTPQGALNDVIVLPFNDVPRTLSLLNQHRDSLASVIIDPLPHRVGLMPASNEFIRAIRDWCTENNSLFILDEVITFRMGFGGAQEWFDCEPDLTAMGKIIGGGFPVGALAGRSQYMNVLDPSRDELPLPHSGTFSANPITMTAGLAAMELFDQKAVESLNELGEQTRLGIRDAIAKSGISACVTGAGSMFRVHLLDQPPIEYRSNYQDQAAVSRIKSIVDFMYANGFMMINTCSGALSTAMNGGHVEEFVGTLEKAFQQI